MIVVLEGYNIVALTLTTLFTENVKNVLDFYK